MASDDTLSRAAHALRALSKRLNILKAIRWPAEIKQNFLAGHTDKLPDISYPSIDVNPILDELSQIRSTLIGSSVVVAWLHRVVDKLELTAKMLGQLGTADFFKYSAKLYGTPDKLLLDRHTKTLDLAIHMDGRLSDLEGIHLKIGGGNEALSAEVFAQSLSQKLEKYFGDDRPKVATTRQLSAKAVAGRTRIRIRASAKFTKMELRQLLHHEALIHTATSQNGYRQDRFPILASSHAGTTEIQEGLAVFAEFITGSMDPRRFKRLVNRVIAIDMAIRGADFVEVYRYFLENDISQDQAFENTRRVFRGGVPSGGAPFTKDIVYLNGLLRVHNFLRTAIQLGRADLIRLLFVGKLDLEDIPALAHLAAKGELKPAHILPPWASDMSFLVSYLAYSSFLNKVKLPGFQSYYSDLLQDVPNLSGFNYGR